MFKFLSAENQYFTNLTVDLLPLWLKPMVVGVKIP